MVVVTCKCGHRMKAPKGLVGKTTSCVKCGERFQVSQENARILEAAQGGGRPPAPPARPAARIERSRLSQMLVEHGLVTEVQLREAEAAKVEEGGRVFEILIDKGYLKKEDLTRMLNEQVGLPPIDLKNFHVSPKVVSLIPRELAHERLVLPIDRVGNLLTVAMACATDPDTIQLVERMTRLRVTAMLCRLDELDAAIERYFRVDEEDETAASYFGAPAVEPQPPRVGPPAPEAPLSPAPSSASAPAVAPAVAPEEAEGIGRRDRVLAMLSDIDALPASRETIDRIEEAAQDPHYPVRDLATICATEPVLVAMMLSITNSAAYGMPDKVDNAYLAATLLGTSGTLRMVKICAEAQARKPASRFNYQTFSLQSRFCAAASQALARATGKIPFATALTAGLLYRIGQLALAVMLPDEYDRLGTTAAGPSLLQAEQALFGLTHAEAGGVLMRQWRLPEVITESIRLYPYPERAKEFDPVAAVVAMAAHMTDVGIRTGAASEFAPHPELMSALGLSKDQCSEILRNTVTAFRG